ncbi:hypothetical protein B0H16DRAFT_1736560 [Mycena metata]|uniref:Uncharacterized protein n=1 Tax=Mycena metata TaxID=1033252 RepID=A0AAD7HNP4_9AGAR|nr:hypothetical protein B0H16DRAFT_1736560 [Mycena metata]
MTELVPAKELLENNRSSHFLTVCFWGYLCEEFANAELYVNSVAGRVLHPVYCTMWIRSSSGRLCVDLTPSASGTVFLYGLSESTEFQSVVALLEPPLDSAIIDAISFPLYHKICIRYLSGLRHLSVPLDASVNLAATIFFLPDSDFTRTTEVAFNPDCSFRDSGWIGRFSGEPTILDSGWFRINAREVIDEPIFRVITRKQEEFGSWLAQSNYIFNRLNITSDFEQYFVVRSIVFEVKVLSTGAGPRPGYLFLCPILDLLVDIPARFQWPSCPAYWSTDPSGTERLSEEQATKLGLPSIKFKWWVHGRVWDESVYTGLYQFHPGKGFDPCSQEVARHLVYPLYQFSWEVGGLSAYVEEVDTSAKVEELRHAETPLAGGVQRAYVDVSCGPAVASDVLQLDGDGDDISSADDSQPHETTIISDDHPKSGQRWHHDTPALLDTRMEYRLPSLELDAVELPRGSFKSWIMALKLTLIVFLGVYQGYDYLFSHKDQWV